MGIPKGPTEGAVVAGEAILTWSTGDSLKKSKKPLGVVADSTTKRKSKSNRPNPMTRSLIRNPRSG